METTEYIKCGESPQMNLFQIATPQNGPSVFSFGGEQREATVDYGVIKSVVAQTVYR